MLGSLGNINKISLPEQHNRIMKTLIDIWKMLCRVNEIFFSNGKFSLLLCKQIHVQAKDTLHGDSYFDGPPLLIFAPWLFEVNENEQFSPRIEIYF